MLPRLNVSLLCPVLIGRKSDLDTFRGLIERVLAGSGQTALVAGEAGIGKSKLVAEIKTLSSDRGFTILQGSCFEPDRTFPYAPFLDLLQAFCVNRPAVEIASAFGQSGPELIKLLPEFASRLPKWAPIPSLEPEAEKRRLFNALAQFLTCNGAPMRHPVLIVIEDLQWCDDTSLEFLLFLARRLAAQPVFLLLTYRYDEVQPALNHFLAELERGHQATEIKLQRLAAAEVDAMLRAIFGLDRPVSAAFLNALYELTDGNPFFIEETLKSLLESGSIFQADGRWNHKPVSDLYIPRNIKETVIHRTEQLSPASRRLLELAAVAGRRFDFDLLQELSHSSEQELLNLIKELVTAQLVAEDSADRFSFRHALTREAIYYSLLMRERKRLHQWIGETLERLHPDPDGGHLNDLAYHTYQAGAWDKTFLYSQRAGEKAQALYAPGTALEQFSHAIEAAQRLGISPGVLYRERGQTYETIGEFDLANADYELALRSAQEAVDRSLEWQALIDLGFLWSGRDYQRAGQYFQRALDLAKDPIALAHSLNRMGNWHANVGGLAEALRFHQQALAIFQQENHRRGLAETLDLLGMASQINGNLFEGTAYYLRAVSLFRELDDRRGLSSSLATLALCGPTTLHDTSLSPTNLNEAISNGESALKVAQAIGWRSGEVYALECLSHCLGPYGNYSRALDLAQRALDIGEEIEHNQWATGAHYAIGAAYLYLLDLSRARQEFEHAFSLARDLGSSVWIGSVGGYLASTCIAQNDINRAKDVLDGELMHDTPMHSQMERLCWCARAELALAIANPKEALEIVEKLIASEPNFTQEKSIPRLGLLRGQALAALNQPDEAEIALKSALESATRLGANSWVWRIYLTLGKTQLSRSRHFDAETTFMAARKTIGELSESIPDQFLRNNFFEQATALLPGDTGVSTRRKNKEEYGGLTLREREVAGQLALGQTNREIAKVLVVSERTVESHITNILSKLGFTSRSQAAVWAVEKGLGKQDS